VAIEVHNVSKRFGTFTALDEVSVGVGDGALTALLGPSGSGKSTLLRIIAGLEHPDAGIVSIGGVDVTDAPARGRGVGFVFQHYAPFKHMTVAGNVAFGLAVRRRPRPEIDARVKELLALVRLEGLAERYPSQLSGGQLQRMALARALAVQPEVLLLDEPFGALDAQVRGELREWLRRLHEEIHVTTIFVTHDQEEAMEVAEQIVLMNDGRIEQAGTPSELYESPRNEFVMSFIGPVNRIGDAFVRPHDIQILPEADATSTEALVQRVVHLGFEVRVELTLPDGRELWAQVTRDSAHQLELAQGQILSVRLPAPRVFAPSGSSRPALRA
jgi:sulfate transport system ATP-binding protein